MNPVDKLDFERRNGYSSKDIDEFVSNVDAVSKAIEQIKTGSFEEKNLQEIPFLKRQQEKEQRLKKLQQQKAEQKLKLQKEWWEKANLGFAERDEQQALQQQEQDPEEPPKPNRIVEAYSTRDANDYSQWAKWEPQDPVTLEEQKEKQEKIEKLQNEQFEKANPEFCSQFIEDMEKRKLLKEEKQQKGNALKSAGNRLYKRKEYQQAIEKYSKALDFIPFSEAVLTNIAQCYLRMQAFDDAIEYCNRALYVKPQHVKALSRRASALRQQKKLREALNDIDAAVEIDPTNPDLLNEQRDIRGQYEDDLAESRLMKKLDSKTTSAANAAGILDFSEYKIIQEFRKLIDILLKKGESDERTDQILKTMSIHQAIGLLLTTNDTKVYLRTSGALSEILNEFNTLVLQACAPEFVSAEEEIGEYGEFDIQHYQKVPDITQELSKLREILDILILAIEQNQRNQEILATKSVLKSLLLLLQYTLQPADIIEELRYQVLSFIDLVDQNSLWQELLLSSPEIFSGLLVHLSRIQQTSDLNRKSCAKVSFVLFSFSSLKKGLKCFQAICPDPLPIIFTSLEQISELSFQLSSIGVVLNLSTNDTIRSRVVGSLRLQQQMVKVLMKLLRSSPSEELRSRITAIFLNFTLEKQSPVRELLFTDGIVSFALSQLPISESTIPVDKIRSIALLSRMISLQDANSSLTSGTTLQLLKTSLKTPNSELQDHLLRIFAAFAENPEVLDVLFLDDGLQMLLKLLPDATKPEEGKRFIKDHSSLLGNLTKILIEATPLILRLPDHIRTLHKTNALANLIFLLQNLSDQATCTRKNVAIVLAKLCSNPELKAQIQQLRGLEILLSITRDIKL